MKSKVQTWGREELKEGWDRFWTVHDQDETLVNADWTTRQKDTLFIQFLNWLSAEELR